MKQENYRKLLLDNEEIHEAIFNYLSEKCDTDVDKDKTMIGWSLSNDSKISAEVIEKLNNDKDNDKED